MKMFSGAGNRLCAMRFSNAIFCLCLLAVVGCKPSSVSSDKELVKFVQDEDNGLKKKIAVGDLEITLTYRPTDLLVAQEVGGEKTPEKISAARKKYNGNYYFVLSLSKSGREALHQTDNFGQYSELVQKLSFRLPEFANMTTAAQDTIPVADFILNRTYGLASSTDLLVVFNKEKALGKEWVQFNLNEFGMNTGNARFRFRTWDLENCPRLAAVN
ncbi:MAG: hypothetical protein ACKO96_47310 [Flammeovirgaceae bacterium]